MREKKTEDISSVVIYMSERNKRKIRTYKKKDL